jgi:formate dehydrogenase assembly factor FdhD
MTLDRRTVLKASAAAGAAIAVPAAALEIRQSLAARLVVYDSRIAESRAFAETQGGHPAIDIADAHADLWRKVRDVAQHGRVDGLTGWSDWVMVRGALQDKGLRLSAEQRAGSPLSGHAHLFRWTMHAR